MSSVSTMFTQLTFIASKGCLKNGDGGWLKVFWNPPVILSRWIRDTWFKAWTGRYCEVDRLTSGPQATKLPSNLQRSDCLSNRLYSVPSHHLIVLSRASAIISVYLWEKDRGKFLWNITSTVVISMVSQLNTLNIRSCPCLKY